ncbi:unnamed protein product, partial [Ectocarpus sp. 12 AP-2014]
GGANPSSAGPAPLLVRGCAKRFHLHHIGHLQSVTPRLAVGENHWPRRYHYLCSFVGFHIAKPQAKKNRRTDEPQAAARRPLTHKINWSPSCKLMCLSHGT